jgi:flagellar motor switch protein FliN
MGVRSVKQDGTTLMRTEMESLPDAEEPGGTSVIPPAVVENVVVDLAVELGRMNMRIRDIKSLRQGEVISLQRPVGDPLDIRINGRIVARGEVVATEGRQYGIRITEIVASEPGPGGA